MTNSPHSYREAISAVLQDLRPQLKVFTAAPEDLDKEFLRLFPQFVICSQVTTLVDRIALAWIELYPGYASESVVSIDGKKTTYSDLDFDTLLSILDKAKRLHETV